MKRKDELRNIYRRDHGDLEKTLTAPVAKKFLAEKQQSLANAQLLAASLGGLAIFLAVALAAITLRTFSKERAIRKSGDSERSVYAPRRTLPAETPWVTVDFSVHTNEVVPGEKPLSAQWIKTAAYHLNEGFQALRNSDTPTALVHLNEVLEIYPSIQEFHLSVGSLYLQNQAFGLAAKHLESALEEKETFFVVDSLGEAYIGLQQYPQAEKQLLRALELQPENSGCHKKLAQLYRTMKQDTSALFHFEKYFNLTPDDFTTMQTYASYLIELGQKKEAAVVLTKLTEGIPDVAPIYFVLARLQIETGETDAAIKNLEKGAELTDSAVALKWLSSETFNPLRGKREFTALIERLDPADR